MVLRSGGSLKWVPLDCEFRTLANYVITKKLSTKIEFIII